MLDLIYTEKEIAQTAAVLADAISGYSVITFNGPMGAGKTTLIAALCQHLGVEGAISSPTYAIVHEYGAANAKTIYHMDWFRLKNEAEAIDVGIEDILFSGKLCLVEWPGQAPGILPDHYLTVQLEVPEPDKRRIVVGKSG